MITCSVCGKDISNYRHHFNPLKCQACYMYFKSGNRIHEKPPHGRTTFDEAGRPICHICGRSFTKLGCHVAFHHKITTDEYCERFGLCRNTQLTTTEYIIMMREYTFENGTIDNLLLHGEETQFEPGCSGNLSRRPQRNRQKRRTHL